LGIVNVNSVGVGPIKLVLVSTICPPGFVDVAGYVPAGRTTDFVSVTVVDVDDATVYTPSYVYELTFEFAEVVNEYPFCGKLTFTVPESVYPVVVGTVQTRVFEFVADALVIASALLNPTVLKPVMTQDESPVIPSVFTFDAVVYVAFVPSPTTFTSGRFTKEFCPTLSIS
jgi:hypothetical protein